ncbi:DUF2627 family protein [Fodinisporobacter ferrooxydans]|uniref:DUF2627 family protein n=1 Tax=Fodinisporobacter ferrooxydans TaxID=2901836 RepID=A0ABY4CHG5_9BACL|nr:DUF2627 family protein [Alicyclobacillaceae bacterium MYW30-H2]
MIRYILWLSMFGIVVLAGEGVNLIKQAILTKLAEPAATVWPDMTLGALLMVGGVSFIGGYMHYRDQKRGRIKKSIGRKQTTPL